MHQIKTRQFQITKATNMTRIKFYNVLGMQSSNYLSFSAPTKRKSINSTSPKISLYKLSSRLARAFCPALRCDALSLPPRRRPALPAAAAAAALPAAAELSGAAALSAGALALFDGLL